MKMPTYFLSHGGGPWPWVPDMRTAFADLEAFLRSLPAQLPRRPEAVLVVSGHWEAPEFTVQAHPHPPMLYDYGGFPEHTYRIRYAAPGHPGLAGEVQQLARDFGVRVDADHERGFDHGTFAMMYPIYPEADVPVLSVSMKQGFDPEDHLRLGRALAPLRERGVLIVGSGNSFHNFHPPRDAEHHSKVFEDWLEHALSTPGETRESALRRWATAPSARVSQPREDHLIPLLVAAGAAHEDPGRLANRYVMSVFGRVLSSSYRFG